MLALLGVAQDFELQIDVGPNAERAVIDRIQIQQVLLNLVRNATEAMSPRGHGKLSIVVRRASNMAEISVTDDGPGLSESVRSKLFQPFVTSKPTGMGVGLSVCRMIVEAHGGKIWAEDARSGGAVFRFTVPVPEAGPQDELRPA